MDKQLPIGIQSFSKLIKRNYLYIDKTRQIKKLIESIPYCFLSRPRRFGKSLLLSTIKEIFAGNRTLFKGLWIFDQIPWETYPIIHLDMLGLQSQTPETLRDSLSIRLDSIAKDMNILLEKKWDCPFKLERLIKELYQTHQKEVVILVDEYDKPIIDGLESFDIATGNRNFLRNFYAVLKSNDEYIHFVLITGVSKFSRTSIFSCLNNLTDITFMEEFSTLAGYTQDELVHYFDDHIDKLTTKMGTEKETCMERIKYWYNGYTWDGVNRVYNPFSILNLFKRQEFNNYWYETGTPTFLITYIKKKEIFLPALDRVTTNMNTFENCDIENIDITSLLFQTGYLTIQERVQVPGSAGEYLFILSYPNHEVTQSFLENLNREYTGKDVSENLTQLLRIKESIKTDNLESFFIELKTLFASIPYNIFLSNKEAYYHTIIYLTLRLAGISILSEIETNIGRIDALIETKEKIYILEFKIGTSEEALQQIKEKRYYESFLTGNKRIGLIGVGFDEQSRNILQSVIEYID